MSDMTGKHSEHDAAGAPLRRAHFAAWAVFLGMAGTSMAFQVFHALKTGDMPGILAVLFGTMLLALSVGALEFSSKWPDAPRWYRPGAYLVIAGAMYLSASATGAVVVRAAPAHMSGLFGILMDAAALLAVHFIFSGPRASQAVAAVARREAELLARIDSERAVREQSEAAGQRAMSDLRSRAEAALSAERTARETAEAELENARRDAAQALERAESLAGKLATASAQKKRARPASSARASAADTDVNTELRAIMELRDNPELLKPRMGGELARRLQIGGSTARNLRAKLVRNGALSEYALSLIGTPAERSE